MVTVVAVPTSSAAETVRKKVPFSGLPGLVVSVVELTMNSNSPAGSPRTAVSKVAPLGKASGSSMVCLVMQAMSGSVDPRISVTSERSGPALRSATDSLTVSPVSAKISESPLMSRTVVDSTIRFASGRVLQETAVPKEIASSGIPLLSSSTVSSGSQASPRPS